MDEIIDDQREHPKKKYGTSFKVLFFIYGFIAIIGYLFKIMHWPGADINLLVGLGALSAHLLVFAFFKSDNKIQKTVAILLPLLFLYLLFGVFRFLPVAIEIYITIFIPAFVLAYLLRK